MNNQAYAGEYQGEKAIWLRSGHYEAALLPEIGGNLVAFRDTTRGFNILREPSLDEMAGFKAVPMVHGIPILFPPNRYHDGKFSLNGLNYEFPVNEAKTGNHLHGFFYNIPWEVSDFGTNDSESYVIIEQNVDEKHSAYPYFPHTFHFSIRYALSEAGLRQEVSITNLGEAAMPCMLGFHTAFNAPFAPNSTQEDITFTMTIGERWELDSRMLPTGSYQPLVAGELAMKSGGVSPYFAGMDNHYTAQPQNGINAIIITDAKEKLKLVYDVGTGYKQWMIWNNEANGRYFCPEPQINTVNAPNLDLPAEQIGLVLLAQGESWNETSKIFIESVVG
ncbi:aldose 1-epimerase [Paenibacillus psychroresistens]|uniref:Aldose 1-epimerase n=1 Tax=Paenibacillus psychroresistens TaxID=1778678 RepID=A0A6B8RUT0_9BACL|nr:aldose 1-epimerase [Paenibacillus psychroresistens]QGQ98888.1 aldose 1-epimerase [Paenibacillus psychroresistens]